MSRAGSGSLVALAALWLTGPVQAAPGDSVHLAAEEVQATPQEIRGRGNVSLDLEGARLVCEQVAIDRATGALKASGRCVFYWETSFVAADEVTFDPTTRKARMKNAAGQGRDLNMGGGDLSGDLFFWTEDLTWDAGRLLMKKATFTTCDDPTEDWHYQFNSEQVEIRPGERLTASNTSFTLQGARLYTLPTLNLSLDPRTRRRRSSLLPQTGSNSIDGFFARNTFDYTLDDRNFGSILLDYYSKTGIGRGFDHFYALGERGEGNLHYYEQSGDTARRRYELRSNIYYRPDAYTSMAWNFNSNRSEIPGLPTPDNLNSQFSVNRYAPGSALQFSHNFNRSGTDTNTTYRMFYQLELTPELSTVWSADLAQATTSFARTRRFHYLGSLRHVGPLFDSDLTVENTSGQQTFFLNRNPELTMRSKPIRLGQLPLLASASFGNVQESPSLFQTTRYDLRLQVPDQSVELPAGRLVLGGGLRQLFYGDGQSQYVLAARAGWLQELGDLGALRLDYNWQLPRGFTPFQHDFVYPFENLTGGLELGDGETFNLSVTSGYDLRFQTFHNVVPRVQLRPAPGWTVTAASNFDPNSRLWRSLDAGIRMQLTEGLSVSHWSLYDMVNGRMTYQDYQVNWEEHDWVTSLVYRGVQNEFFLQFSLKAFPTQPVSVGPNVHAPILPQNLPNAFVR